MGSNKILSLVSDREHGCRRQWPRQPLLLPARLLTTSGESPIRIRDLSAGGVRIEGSGLPEVGTDVLVKRGPFEAFGTIAWLSGDYAGVEFDEPLDDDGFAALEQVQPAASPAPHLHSVDSLGFGRKRSDHSRWSDGSGWIDLN